MQDNFVIIDFPHETAAYQALTALRTQVAHDLYHLQGAAIVQRQADGTLDLHPDGQPDAVTPEPAVGALLGGLVGLLGGPLGAAVGLAAGAALGKLVRTEHVDEVSRALTAVADEVGVSGAALLLAVQEREDHAALNDLAAKLGGQISRAPRAVIGQRLREEGRL